MWYSARAAAHLFRKIRPANMPVVFALLSFFTKLDLMIKATVTVMDSIHSFVFLNSPLPEGFAPKLL
jgi:hypothetical protein